MNKLRYAVVAVTLLLAHCIMAQEKVDTAAASKEKADVEIPAIKGLKEQKVYMFAVGNRLSDSTVYVSDILEVDKATVVSKTGFISYRSAYSLQFRQYLEGVLGETNETCCVYFAQKRKELSKKYYKVKKRYLDNPDKTLVIVGADKFTFSNPTE